MAKEEKKERQFIFTSKNIDEITEKMNDGIVIERYRNPWFKNEIGVRRNGISFAPTAEELQEYIRCKVDIHYFAEKYCKVKTEDGSVGNITLRDYQKDILDLYDKNRFSILVGSRQIGKCNTFLTKIMLTDVGEITIGELYFKELSKIRSLSIFEKIKYFLYKLL